MTTFDWAQFNAVARQLLSASLDEAGLRSAISRAYYAVFCTARVRATLDGYAQPKQASVHKALWTYYQGSGNPAKAQLAIDADRLRDLRVKADYVDPFPNSLTTTASDAVDEAARLLAVIASL